MPGTSRSDQAGGGQPVTPDSGPTWPPDWDDLYTGRMCSLCQSLSEDDNAHSVLIRRGRHADVRIDRKSAIPGYCLVIWNGRHVAELGELTGEELAGYWREVVAVGGAIEAAFRPLKLNYQILGNAVPHLHTHVLPRYRSDPAPGGPLPWSEALGEPLADAELRRQAALIAEALGRPAERRVGAEDIRVDESAVGDLGQVEELWKALYRHHRQVAPHLDEWVTDEETSWVRRRRRYSDWLEAGRGLLLIARSGEEAVGYAMVEIFPPSAGESRGTYQVPIRAELQTLSVAEAYRGRGIGRVLFDAVRVELRRHGVSVFTVAIMSGNDSALRFYESLSSIPWVTSILHRVD